MEGLKTKDEMVPDFSRREFFEKLLLAARECEEYVSEQEKNDPHARSHRTPGNLEEVVARHGLKLTTSETDPHFDPLKTAIDEIINRAYYTEPKLTAEDYSKKLFADVEPLEKAYRRQSAEWGEIINALHQKGYSDKYKDALDLEEVADELIASGHTLEQIMTRIEAGDY